MVTPKVKFTNVTPKVKFTNILCNCEILAVSCYYC